MLSAHQLLGAGTEAADHYRSIAAPLAPEPAGPKNSVEEHGEPFRGAWSIKCCILNDVDDLDSRLLGFRHGKSHPANPKPPTPVRVHPPLARSLHFPKPQPPPTPHRAPRADARHDLSSSFLLCRFWPPFLTLLPATSAEKACRMKPG